MLAKITSNKYELDLKLYKIYVFYWPHMLSQSCLEAQIRELWFSDNFRNPWCGWTQPNSVHNLKNEEFKIFYSPRVVGLGWFPGKARKVVINPLGVGELFLLLGGEAITWDKIDEFSLRRKSAQS